MKYNSSALICPINESTIRLDMIDFFQIIVKSTKGLPVFTGMKSPIKVGPSLFKKATIISLINMICNFVFPLT